MDAFEKHLNQIKYQSPPDSLRDRCLVGLNPTPESKSNNELSNASIIEGFWTRWLWPHPKAWAGLACIWFICFGLNHWTLPLTQFSDRSQDSNHTRHATPPISVMHYSLAMDSELETWAPEATASMPETGKDGIKPSAFRKLKYQNI